MKRSRIPGLIAAVVATAIAPPASAQFFFQSPVKRTPPVTGAEPGMAGPALTGATPAEYRAALVWNLRAALNVAALQCDFAPYLLTLDSYNQVLGDHAAELASSYAVLTAYFTRTAKTKKDAQKAIDTYGTRVYSSFSVVSAQLTFCLTAGEVAQAAVFTPRGSFGTLAEERMGEMRNALVFGGEQRFPGGIKPNLITLPRLDAICWKGSEWVARKCGPQGRWGGA